MTKLRFATASLLTAAAVGCIFIVQSHADAAVKYKNTVAQKYWVKYGINPWSNDTDGDKVTDAVEIKKGLCPTNSANIKLTNKACLKGVINLKKGTYVPPKNMRPAPAVVKVATTTPTAISTTTNIKNSSPSSSQASTITNQNSNTQNQTVVPVLNNASGVFVPPVQPAAVAVGASFDTKRLADLKQLQTALELFYADASTYPAGTGVVLGQEPNTCLNSDGWQPNSDCAYPYYAGVPSDPGSKQYIYTGSGSSYTIDAVLDGTVGNLSGKIRLSPSGVVKIINN